MEFLNSLKKRSKFYDTPFDHWELNQPLTREAIKEICTVEIVDLSETKLIYDGTRALDGGEGTYSLPLRYGAGSFEVNRDENPYGEFKEDDGISQHIQGGVSLLIDVTHSGHGKSLMNAQIVRNVDKDTITPTPVDKLAVRDKG